MQQHWLKRWEEGRIGFHRDSVHPALIRHWPMLGAVPGTKVLVPLCGKSLDMRWLAEHQHPVLGIELSGRALEQFVEDGRGEVSRYQQEGFAILRQGSIELWCGDFFHFHIAQASEIGAFYDRAALFALPGATPVHGDLGAVYFIVGCANDRPDQAVGRRNAGSLVGSRAVGAHLVAGRQAVRAKCRKGDDLWLQLADHLHKNQSVNKLVGLDLGHY